MNCYPIFILNLTSRISIWLQILFCLNYLLLLQFLYEIQIHELTWTIICVWANFLSDYFLMSKQRRQFVQQKSFVSTRQFEPSNSINRHYVRFSVRVKPNDVAVGNNEYSTKFVDAAVTLSRKISAANEGRIDQLRKVLTRTDEHGDRFVEKSRKSSLEPRKSSLIGKLALKRAKSTVRKISAFAMMEMEILNKTTGNYL